MPESPDNPTIKQTTRPAFWMRQSVPAKLYKAVRKRQGDIRIVGGAVRDYLLGRAITDIDFACTLPPEDIKRVAQDLSAKVRLHGEAHGTVMVILKGRSYEVTSLRRDIRTFGRRAQVEFGGDWQSDAGRRDFTINAMSMDSKGNIYDYCGGLQDLQKYKGGYIQFIGDAERRIQEDYLRILRFFRLYGILPHSRLQEDALVVCERHAECLKDLSAERKRDEFLKLLAGQQAEASLSLMAEHGILQALGLPAPPTVPNFATIRGEEQMMFYLWAFAVAGEGIGEGRGEGGINDFCKNWRLTNRQRRFLLSVSGVRQQLSSGEGGEGLDYLLQVHGGAIVRIAVCHAGDAQAWAEANVWEERDFPVTGNDIKSLLGCEGKEVGDYFDKGIRHWLSGGRVMERDALLNWYKTLAKD